MLLGYANKQTYIDASQIMPPYLKGYFCYGFYITIYDFYKKGISDSYNAPIPQNGSICSYLL